jgi:hypothetical protein
VRAKKLVADIKSRVQCCIFIAKVGRFRIENAPIVGPRFCTALGMWSGCVLNANVKEGDRKE